MIGSSESLGCPFLLEKGREESVLTAEALEVVEVDLGPVLTDPLPNVSDVEKARH
jgi:hypothetical protein